MKWIKEHNESTSGRGWNNWRSEDGRFFIRQSGHGGARWIMTTTDGSEPFTGYRGKRSHVSNADTIAEAKGRCELVSS